MDKDIINKDIKIKYIYDKVTNHSINSEYIKSFIDLYEIKFTENMNGIFINLTLLDEHIIEGLYKYIYEYLHNFIEENRETIINNLKIENDSKSIKKKKQFQREPAKKYKSPPKLTDIEKDIIELSLTI